MPDHGAELPLKVCPACGDVVSDEHLTCPRDGVELRAVKDPFLGKTVGGRYRLISKLGSGGMSSVYLARHVMIDRLVAVKTLRRDLAQDPVQRDRFIREARAVNRINHDNIVEITDFGETEDGVVYLVMEYVPGEPLFKAMELAPFQPARALVIAEQIGGALGRAHQMGVVHRDLKPENILLVPKKDGADFVKILDFGIAKILDAPSLTHSQQIFGTPGYIAPEYIQSAEIDGRADLYSLGVIFYEMVTGALPFDYEFPGDLLVKHVSEAPVAPRERLASVEEPLERLILRCLEKKPDERFRDAYHFLDELRRTRERLGASASSWGAMSEVTPAFGSEAPTSPTMAEAPPTIRENREVFNALMAIPSAPLEVVSPEPVEAPQDYGLVGVLKWRLRHDALQSALDDLSAESLPHHVTDAMHFARETLKSLEGGVETTEEHQRQIEKLSEEARDYQTTLGRAIDRAAEQLSQARGAFEVVARRRNQLRSRHEGLSASVRRGDGDEGAADSVLWELASIEQELQKQGLECDRLEAQLSELRKQLEHRSETVEARRAELVSKAAGEMERLDALALALRDPLAKVEEFVRACWEQGSSRPA